MGIENDLANYSELLRTGRYEDAALLGETLIPQLVEGGRPLDAVEILSHTIKYSQNPIAISQAWSQTGKVLYENNFFDRARAAYHVALERTDSGDTLGRVQLLFSIANTHFMEGSYMEARANYEESFSLSESEHFPMGIIENALQLMDVTKVLEELDRSRFFAERALVECGRISNQGTIRRAVVAVVNLAAWLRTAGRNDDANGLLLFAKDRLPASLPVELRSLLETPPM